MQWLTSVKGHRFALTGAAWCFRADLKRAILRAGGTIAPDAGVTKKTTVLVRGISENWEYRDYGKEEKHAADLRREGQDIMVVDHLEFRKLLEHGRRARASDRIAGQPFDQQEGVSRKQFQEAAAVKGPLDRELTKFGRVEQGFLRRWLFSGAQEYTCALCGRSLPSSLLVAAHIKPRKNCSQSERLDFKNVVFGVCVLGCDALYEKGLLAVFPRGRIGVVKTGQPVAVERFLLGFRGRKCDVWAQSNSQYFAAHRSQFKKRVWGS